MISVLEKDLLRLIVSYLPKENSAVSFCCFPHCSKEEDVVFLSFYYKGTFVSNYSGRKQLSRVIHRLCINGNVVALQMFLTFYYPTENIGFMNLSETFATIAKAGHTEMIRFLLTRPLYLLPGTEFRNQAERAMCLFFLAKFGRDDLFLEFFDAKQVEFRSDIDTYYCKATSVGNVPILQCLFSKTFEPRFPTFLYQRAASRGHVDVLRFFDSKLTFPPRGKSTSPWKSKSNFFRTLTHLSEMIFSHQIPQVHLCAYELATRKGKINVLLYLEEKFPFLRTCHFSVSPNNPFIKVHEHFAMDINDLPLEKIFFYCMEANLLEEAKYMYKKYPLQLEKRITNSNQSWPQSFTGFVRSDNLISQFSDVFFDDLKLSSIQFDICPMAKRSDLFLLSKEFSYVDMLQTIYSRTRDRRIRKYISWKWGFQPKSKLDYRKAFEDAACDGDVERLTFLHQHYADQISFKKQEEKEETGNEPLLETIARNGFLSIIRFLLQFYSFEKVEKIGLLKGAIETDKFHIVQYVIETMNEKSAFMTQKDLDEAFFQAAQNGSLRIVKFFCETKQIQPDICQRNLEKTKQLNSVGIINYLDQEEWLDVKDFINDFWKEGVLSGDMDLLTYVLKKGIPSPNLVAESILNLYHHPVSLELIHFLFKQQKQLGLTREDFEHAFCTHFSAKDFDQREVFLFLRSVLRNDSRK